MKTMKNGLSDLGRGYTDEMDGVSIDDLAEDYEFFGLDNFVTPEMLQSHLIAAAAGAGGILAVMNIMDRIDYFADKPKAKMLTEALVGLVGGRALWEVNRDAAMGFVGGVTGYSLASLINQYIAEMQTTAPAPDTTADGLAYTEVHRVPAYRKLDRVSVPANWGGGRAPANMGADIVTRANYSQTHGFAESEDVASWLG
ncbi:MAG TPA: hypothetical protein PKD27_02450 [Tepidiformaceae bacterium]|nr:hypothetical protein [Tepidiformaceae bacterium]